MRQQRNCGGWRAGAGRAEWRHAICNESAEESVREPVALRVKGEVAMSETERRPVHLEYPKTHVRRPMIYELGRRFRVVTDICAANMTASGGWADIELIGAADEIDRALDWLRGEGIRVSPLETTPDANEDDAGAAPPATTERTTS